MANDEWMTPEWVWKPYAPFDLDAAATAENALAPTFITKEMDAFKTSWLAVCPAPAKVWCNPPYSQAAGPLGEWVGMFDAYRGMEYHIFALLPSDTSTKWFHSLWGTASYIKFLDRRVRHIDPITKKPGGSPKFGSLIAEFIPEKYEARRLKAPWKHCGICGEVHAWPCRTEYDRSRPNG